MEPPLNTEKISMSDNAKIDSLIKRILAAVPADLQQTKKDIQTNLKAALQKAFADMDLVTREEFDVQSELLSRTRAALIDLEKKLAELEKSINDQK